MLTPQSSPDHPPQPEAFRHPRSFATQTLHAFRNPDNPCASQRAFARQHEVPRSTLQYWQGRADHPDLDLHLARFLESPTGLDFLRRIVLAVHLVFHLDGTAGIRPLVRFLELTQLDRFVAPSYGSQQELSVTLQQLLAVYGQEEQQRLSPAMTPRDITLCPDENFHGPHPCLVAIEPTSNFILVEQYASQRDEKTWTAAIREATQGLPVTVTQLTSDEARGLIACARHGLEAHHQPDLFHRQRDLSQATARPLQQRTAQAERNLNEEQDLVEQQRQRQEDYHSRPRGPGRPPDFAKAIAFAQGCAEHAAGQLADCHQRQEQARQAVRGLADAYHPFDPDDGRPLDQEQVRQRLQQQVATLAEVAEQADLPQHSRQAVSKATAWLTVLAATVGWFWEGVQTLLDGLELSAEALQQVRRKLLPGLYWQQAAGRGRDAAQVKQRARLAERLLAEAWLAAGPLGRLPEEEQQRVRAVAAQAAGLFVRCSSCVEGRNGHLSLYHHGQGRLSDRRLKSLTVIHNFVARRVDGTTAAERFFGQKPRDVFSWLLERMPELPRPAQKRRQTNPKS